MPHNLNSRMTLYQRIEIYCSEKKLPLPSAEERLHLGKIVAMYVRRCGRVVSDSEKGWYYPAGSSGTMKVNDYADESYPAIDFLIAKYLDQDTS